MYFYTFRRLKNFILFLAINKRPGFYEGNANVVRPETYFNRKVLEFLKVEKERNYEITYQSYHVINLKYLKGRNFRDKKF